MMKHISTRSCRRGGAGEELGPGDWLCEAHLWTQWRHRGRLAASTPLTCLALDSNEFARIVHVLAATVHTDVLEYARSFVTALNAHSDPELGSMPDDRFEMRSGLQQKPPRVTMGLELKRTMTWETGVGFITRLVDKTRKSFEQCSLASAGQ